MTPCGARAVMGANAAVVGLLASALDIPSGRARCALQPISLSPPPASPRSSSGARRRSSHRPPRRASFSEPTGRGYALIGGHTGSGQTSSKTRNKSYNKLKTLSMTLLSKTISCQGRESVLFLFFHHPEGDRNFFGSVEAALSPLATGRDAWRAWRRPGAKSQSRSPGPRSSPADAALAATVIAPGSPGSKERIFPTLIRVQPFEKSRILSQKWKDFFGASRA
jgi:hypothetical protein